MGLRGYCTDMVVTSTYVRSPHNPPVRFGFTYDNEETFSYGAYVILTPNSADSPPTFTFTGHSTGTATLNGMWTTGTLDDFFGLLVSPTQDISAFLPYTMESDPSATGFNVYAINLFATVAYPHTQPGASPLEYVAPALPIGSWIVGLMGGGGGGPDMVAPEHGWAIFVGPAAAAKPGFVQGGRVVLSESNLAVAGMKPSGVAARGQVVYRKPVPTVIPWQILYFNSSIASPVTIDSTGATMLVASCSGANTTGVINDSRGNTWITRTVTYVTGCICYCLNPTSVGPNHTISPTGNYPVTVFAALKGPPVVYDMIAGTATSRPGPMTPSKAPSINFTACVTNAGALSVSSPYALIAQRPYGAGVNYGGALAWYEQTVAGPTDPIWATTTPTGTLVASFVSP